MVKVDFIKVIIVVLVHVIKEITDYSMIKNFEIDHIIIIYEDYYKVNNVKLVIYY